MNDDALHIPTARTWRDIPQPAVPRAMSREGRWRLMTAALRVAAVVVACAALGWCAWFIAVAVRKDPRAMPRMARTTTLKALELRTDGVLDDAWLTRTLALPGNASLLELDLQALRARLVGDDQVVNATLTRRFPDRLVVQLTERLPIARLMTEWFGRRKMLLVARDGVVFGGMGYQREFLETLPWLDGVVLTPDGGRFRPIEGMTEVAELLAKARLEAEHLYATWQVVSLARLVSDHCIEVRTTERDGSCVIVFTTRDDYFRQLAKLDTIWDRLQGASARVDLSLGEDVPVMPAAPPAPSPPAAKAPGSSQVFFVVPHPQPSRTQREL